MQTFKTIPSTGSPYDYPNCKAFNYQVAILQRLLYKNSNQHSKSQHFKKLQAVKKLLVRFRNLQWDLLSKTFKKTKKTILEPQIQEQNLISIQKSLISGSLLLQALVPALQNSYLAFKLVAAQTFFMASSLILMSILATVMVQVKEIRIQCDVKYSNVVNQRKALRNDNPTLIGEVLPFTMDAIGFDMIMHVEEVQMNLDVAVMMNLAEIEMATVPMESHLSEPVSVDITDVEKEEINLTLKVQECTSLSDSFFSRPGTPSKPSKPKSKNIRKDRKRPRIQESSNDIDDIFGGL